MLNKHIILEIGHYTKESNNNSRAEKYTTQVDSRNLQTDQEKIIQLEEQKGICKKSKWSQSHMEQY